MIIAQMLNMMHYATKLFGKFHQHTY